MERKRQISSEIDGFCKDNPVNKYRLLQEHQIGYYVALLSAIRFRPEASDHELIKEMNSSLLRPGFAQYKVMDAVEALKNGKHLTHEELRALQAWLIAMPGLTGAVKDRVQALV